MVEHMVEHTVEHTVEHMGGAGFGTTREALLRTAGHRARRVWWALVALAAAMTAVPGCSDTPQTGAIYIPDTKGGDVKWGLGDAKGDANSDAAEDASDDIAQEDAGPGTDDVISGPIYVYYDLGIAAGQPPKGDDGIPCLDGCQVTVTQNSSRTIGALVLAGGKTPVPNVMVQFALKDPSTTLGTILSGSVPTDENGRATTTIKGSSSALGVFDVEVTLPELPEALPITYTVSVQSKIKGPPTITVHPQVSASLSSFGDVNVRLLKQVNGLPLCKDLDLFDVNNLPPAVSTSPNLKFDKPWTVSSAYTGTLPPDGSDVAFTVIALGWKAGTGSLTGNPVIGGCADTGFTVHLNKTTKGAEGDSLVINIRDLPLRLKGVYDMTTFVDLLTLLPPNVEKFVKIILNIISDPVAGLLATICQLTNGSIQDICAAVFQDPNNPDPNKLSGVGGLVVDFLGQILLSALPPQVQQVITSTKDIKNILQNFTINGTIEINAEPDSNGYLSDKWTLQTWSSITYKWSLGQSCPPSDPNCGLKTINFDQFQPNVVTGKFELWRNFLPNSKVPDDTIKIGKHALDVKWGALINFILEKQILPLVFFDPKDPSAPTIDSYEKLLKYLLAGNKQCLIKDTCCAEFVNGISSSGLANTLLTTACDAATVLGPAFLSSYLNTLDTVTGNPQTGAGLLLGTPKCPILDPNGDNIVDNLGSPDTSSTVNQCQWDMTLGIGGGTPKAISARFFATRQ